MKRAKEIMTRKLVTALPDTPVLHVIDLLLEHRLHGIPVVDASNKLLGIVTQGDLLYRIKLPTVHVQILQEGAYCDPTPFIKKYSKIGGTTVKDVMTKEVFTAPPDQTIDKIVDLMLEKKIHMVPIMRGEHIIGVVSRTDILRFLASLEREIESQPVNDDDIRETVTAALKKNICAPVNHLQIRVVSGNVYIKGEIESPEHHHAVEAIVQSIRGVKNIHNDLLVTHLLD